MQIGTLKDIDFIAITKNTKKAVVAVTFFRIGKNVGTETFLMENIYGDDDLAILESFVTQFYRDVNTPQCVVSDVDLADSSQITEFFEMFKRQSPKLVVSHQGVYKRILDSCRLNANMKLRDNRESEMYTSQLADLCAILNVEKLERIETYDNSHIQGTNAGGVMIVFSNGDFQKNQTKKFSINTEIANGGDDIAMMKFVLEKRFNSKKVQEIPDLIIMDGGKTQVAAAMSILKHLALSQKIQIIGIAKQNNRSIGDEKLVFSDGSEKILEKDNELLQFLIMLRNKAHESAIAFHRKKRAKTLLKSTIDEIPSVGPVRKKLLLEHFGSINLIKAASIDDIKMIKGIDDKTAVSIFNFFRRRSK
jgi:excinuclease ABC subunit C